MRIEQMFASPYLQAEDLRAYNSGITIVTIEDVTYKTKEARNVGEAEIDYFLKLREFRKPMRLKKVNADQIAALLGTRETDEWRGQTIGVFPIQVRVPNPEGGTKMVWVINVDIVKPTTAPELPPGSDITGMAYEQRAVGGPITSGPRLPAGQWPAPARPVTTGATPPGTLTTAGDNSPIGIERAMDIISALHERGRTWDDLVHHFKLAGQSALIEGKRPPDVTAAVVPLARAFVRDLPKVRPSLDAPARQSLRNTWEPPAQVIDRSTGEVIQPAEGMPPDDDIPF